MTVYMVFAIVFLAASALAFVLLDMAFSDDRQVSRRLKGLTEYEVGQAHEAQPMLAPFRTRVLQPVGDTFVAFLKVLWPADYRQRLTVKLERAGRPHGMDASRFVVAKVFCGFGLLAVGLGLGVFFGWSAGIIVFAMVGLMVLGLYLPDLWLNSELHSRQHRIVLDLPDMLDMLTISVEAGLGFDAALAKIVRTTKGPLSEEFGRVLQETQAGSSRREALRHMAERVDVPELSAFTASIIQADIFGISIAQVLRTQAVEMRLRRRQRAEEQAAKVPVKMVVPLTLCIMPATIIVVAGPAILGIMKAFGG